MLLLIWWWVFLRRGNIVCVSFAPVFVRCGLDDIGGGSGWYDREAEADGFGTAEIELFGPSLGDVMKSIVVCATIALVELTVDEVDVAECVCMSEEEGL
jgi:hypothetical protein